jgi:hypothetical protein
MSLPEELFYEFVKRPTSDHKAAKLLLELVKERRAL